MRTPRRSGGQGRANIPRFASTDARAFFSATSFRFSLFSSSCGVTPFVPSVASSATDPGGGARASRARVPRSSGRARTRRAPCAPRPRPRPSRGGCGPARWRPRPPLPRTARALAGRLCGSVAPSPRPNRVSDCPPSHRRLGMATGIRRRPRAASPTSPRIGSTLTSPLLLRLFSRRCALALPPRPNPKRALIPNVP